MSGERIKVRPRSRPRIKIERRDVERRRKNSRWLNDHTKACLVGGSSAVLFGTGLGYLTTVVSTIVAVIFAFAFGLLVAIAVRFVVRKHDSITDYVIPGVAVLLGLATAEVVYASVLSLDMEQYMGVLIPEILGLKSAGILLGEVGVVVGSKVKWREDSTDTQPLFPINVGHRRHRFRLHPPDSVPTVGHVLGTTEVSTSRIGLSETVGFACRYCGGSIDPDDELGTVVCPICHARHHAECWVTNGGRCSGLH